MSVHFFTNSTFRTRVVSYERLAVSPKGVWFREFLLFCSDAEVEYYINLGKTARNIRGVEVYDILIDLAKPKTIQTLPKRLCVGCGKAICGDNANANASSRQAIMCNGSWYCCYDCFCEYMEKKK